MRSEQLFDQAGRALYGDLYVAALADLVRVDKNTVSKWRLGKALVPAGIWRTILEEIEARERVLGLLRNQIIHQAVAAPRSDGRVDAIGPHYPPNASNMFVNQHSGLHTSFPATSPCRRPEQSE
ncbi:MAG: hypothetical protein QOJ15_6610 [Bradyrhizobium sp.]|jgi:hypothetical protein|nr:hypothetical protein [Bradyrhizobium sp.]